MKMNKVLGGVAASVLLIAAGSAVALPPPLPGPANAAPPAAQVSDARMTFERPSHDFGVVWDHRPVETTFAFTNTGTEPLVIQDIRSTCGCTVPDLEKTEYAPGESGEVTVIFNPANRKGQNNRTITITTNDSSQRVHSLDVSAMVKPVLFIGQQFIRMNMDKGDPQSTVLNVGGRSDAFEAKLKSVDMPGLVSVTPTATKTIEHEGETWKQISFDVSSLETAKVGNHRFVLTFETNDERRAEFTIQAILNVKGDLQATPGRLALGRLAKDAPFEQKLTIASRKAKPFKILRVEDIGSLVGNMTIDVAPAAEGKMDAYTLTVRGTPRAELRQSGNIIVHTDMEDEPTIEVAYYGWVPRMQSNAPKPPARDNAGGDRP
jgi:hypothetical protein